MKYQPTFDQIMCHELGISASDGMLLDLLVNAPVWANSINFHGENYYYLAQSKIMEELPTVFRSKQAVARAVKRLGSVLITVKVGRCNYYRVKEMVSKCWYMDNKKQETSYRAFVEQQHSPRRDSFQNKYEITVPKIEPNSLKNRIYQSTADHNPSINIKQPPERNLVSNFEKFWKAYPKKRSKDQARKAFSKRRPNEHLLEKIIQVIEQAKQSVEWQKDAGRFIPYPATWLNAAGWEDEYKQQPSLSADDEYYGDITGSL